LLKTAKQISTTKKIRAGNGTRTRVYSLEGYRSTTELCPLVKRIIPSPAFFIKEKSGLRYEG
jgi:hypothetical protein